MLSIEKVGMRFGGLEVLSDISFEVGPGEIVGVIGPNGAGKTTLFNLITGIYSPAAGQISFGGTRIDQLAPYEIARLGIARTFQNIRLFARMTVAQTVETALVTKCPDRFWSSLIRFPGYQRRQAERHAQIHALLARFGLGEFADQLATSLPYGLQRKLEIVRALATQPSLILLDEPAAGMNTVEKAALKDLITLINTEFSVSIVLIEHDVKLVMGVVNRVVVLDHGLCIAAGVPEMVRRDPAVIAAYLGPNHA